MAFPSRARDYATREVLKDLIRMYQNEPCLWRVKHIGYHSRYRRNAALDKLLKKYREVEPKATRDDVSKKINSMRSSYHKERRKIEAAERAGYVHEPKLWCFKLLAFLEDKDAPAPASASAAAAVEAAETNGKHNFVEVELIKGEYEEPDDKEISSGRSSRQSIDKSDNEDPIRTLKTSSKPKKVKVRNENANDTWQSEDDPSQRSRPTEDRHEVFSKYIAYKLRDLPKHQGLLAEKLINDVLFEAQWGNLTLTHKLAN